MARKLAVIAVRIVLTAIVFAGVPGQAADLHLNAGAGGGGDSELSKTLLVAQKSESTRLICGWIGPGGRAVYRCR